MTRHSTLRRLLALAVPAALLIAACGDDDDAADTSTVEQTAAPANTATVETAAEADATNETAPAAEETTPSTMAEVPEQTVGGSATIVTGFNFRSLDPATFVAMNASVGTVETMIYDVLFYESFETLEVEGRLGESIESDDAVTWTVTLKPDLQFSDGTPLDAEAVKFNWERFANPELASPSASAAAQIASMEAVDAATLEVTLVAASSQFPRTVAQFLSVIASPTALQQFAETYGTSPETTVGAGPFLLTEIVPDSRYSFERNETYWDAPRPYLDSVTVEINSDDASVVNAVLGGQAQAAYVFSPANVASAIDSGALPVPDIAPQVPLAWVVNSATGSLADFRIRQALHMGLDSTALNEILNSGTGEILDGRNFLPDSSPYFDSALGYPAYDPDEAQRLIDEVAGELGGPVKVTHLVSPNSQPQALALQTIYSQFDNLEYELSIVQPGDYPGKVFAKEFDVALWTCPREVGADPMPQWYDCFYSTSRSNVGGYNNPEMDAALDVAKSSLDDDERSEAIATIQGLLAAELPGLWSGVGRPANSSWITTEAVTGVEYVFPGGVFISEVSLSN